MRSKSYLKIIREILVEAIKYPDRYQINDDMATVCRHLATYCKLKRKDDYKKFSKLSGVFEHLYDKNRRKLCRIEVLEDYKNAKFLKDKSIEGSRYVTVIDAKGKKLTILRCLDGSTVIEFWNTRIEIPTRIVEYLEQRKK